MSTVFVTTTIHVPVLLKDYCANAKMFGHDDVRFIVIGDKKTPAEVKKFCEQLQKDSGYEIEFYDIDDQRNFMKPYIALHDHIPYNCIQRRNIGLLRAYQTGADTIITIDDDNYVQLDDDYVTHQRVVGTQRTVTKLSSNTGWYNVCEMLVEEHSLPFYHRGYPLKYRWIQSETTTTQEEAKIVVNAGLWLEAPDIDALTWLDLPIRTTAYKSEYQAGIALAPGTWSPFNSQNTALAREVIPGYFLSPYLKRYDDIWASYIVKKIADHLGHVLHFGPPVVKQNRNIHNYLKDFDAERLGMEATGQFVDALRNFDLKGSIYHDCFGELVEIFRREKQEIFKGLNPEHVRNIDQMIDGMQLWYDAYTKL